MTGTVAGPARRLALAGLQVLAVSLGLTWSAQTTTLSWFSVYDDGLVAAVPDHAWGPSFAVTQPGYATSARVWLVGALVLGVLALRTGRRRWLLVGAGAVLVGIVLNGVQVHAGVVAGVVGALLLGVAGLLHRDGAGGLHP